MGSAWFQPRLYAGLLFTGTLHDCGRGVSPCNVDTQMFFTGGKLRLLAPFPWVAPFLELGLGVSLGHFETEIGAEVARSHTGAALNLPIGLGLAVGPRHQLELTLELLLLPGVAQATGGLGAGIAFPFSFFDAAPSADDAPLGPARALPADETMSIPGACRTDADCKKTEHCYTGVGTEGLCMPNGE